MPARGWLSGLRLAELRRRAFTQYSNGPGVVERNFMDDFRRFFLRGLGALVPTLLTIAILVWAYKLVNENVGSIITEGLMRLCALVRDEPAPWLLKADHLELALDHGRPLDEWNELGQRLTIEYQIIKNYKVLQDNGLSGHDPAIIAAAAEAKNRALWQIAFVKYKLHLIGFLIAIILVYFTGFFLASFIGRNAWRAAEGLLYKIPVIRAVYPNIKQVTDFLLTEKGSAGFSGVVAVQYPRRGCWSIGLSTGGPLRQLQGKVSDELVSVFIPSSPTPITGYVVQIPRSEVIELNLTIDEGLRFTVSAGVIKPEGIGDLVRDKGVDRKLDLPDGGDEGESSS